MKYAILSDVHANLTALENVLKDAENHGVEKIVCLGDVVGYGPLPAETLSRIRACADVVLAGNHDDAVSGRIDADDFIDLAADAVKRHREALADEDLAWLKSLPYTAGLEGAIAAHGDFTDPPAFRYMMDADTVTANLKATTAQLMFVGHTHVPGVYLVGNSGRLYRIDPEDFALEDHKRYIVNPGSVGYPRESRGQCYSSYVLYDSSEKTIQFRLLPFTVSSVMQRGVNPKTVKKRIIIAAVALAALLAGGLAWLCAPEKEVEVEKIVENTIFDDDPALLIDRKILTLPKNARVVRAGYTIEPGGALANLRIIFRSADGTELETLNFTPKASDKRPRKIPAGALSAEFTIRRKNLNENPKILTFAPDWE